VLSNFLLLASTVEYLDLVLNSTAIVFIIELDDAAMSADAEAVNDLFRGACYKCVGVDPDPWAFGGGGRGGTQMRGP